MPERFWLKVERTDGCWLWQGGRMRAGYGVLGNLGLAHRVSWNLHYGAIPENTMVLHHCDTPPCVRPDHLFLGTALDNTRDCIAKGRRIDVRGVQVKLAKLTDSVVRRMRLAYAQGHSTRAIARQVGVDAVTVWKAVTHRTWRHVEP